MRGESSAAAAEAVACGSDGALAEVADRPAVPRWRGCRGLADALQLADLGDEDVGGPLTPLEASLGADERGGADPESSHPFQFRAIDDTKNWPESHTWESPTPSVGPMLWPPKIGSPLLRAAEAWCTRVKLVNWVLGEEGHADEWRRVFRVEAADAEFVWEAIASAVPERPIIEVRGKGRTVSYGVLVDLMIKDRFAPVLTAWHYEDPSAAPRLVTAYPRFYTRRNDEDA